MFHDENGQQSLTTLSPEAAQPKIGVHTTESHSVQQSTSIKRLMEISGGAFRNSSSATSMGPDIKYNIVLAQDEPYDRLLTPTPQPTGSQQQARDLSGCRHHPHSTEMKD
jgi:hypothetical protein